MNDSITKISLAIWGRALIIYAILNIFTLGAPYVFVISISYAFTCSIPGLIAFGFVLNGLYHIHIKRPALMPILLAIASIITFGCTVIAVYHFTEGRNLWQSYQENCLFPLAGILSAIVSTAISKERLLRLFYPKWIAQTDSVLHTLITATHEN
jgi:hypothetical protein